MTTAGSAESVTASVHENARSIYLGAHSGAKDDVLIYDKDGVLADKLSPSGERFIDMSSQLGWDNVWGAIVKVHDGG